MPFRIPLIASFAHTQWWLNFLNDIDALGIPSHAEYASLVSGKAVELGVEPGIAVIVTHMRHLRAALTVST